MKWTATLLLILFSGMDSFAQNIDSACMRYVEVNIDKITGKKLVGGASQIIVSKDKKNGARIIFVFISGDQIVMDFGVVGEINCVGEKDKIYFLFEGDDRINVMGNQDFNCKGEYTIYMGKSFGNYELMEKLRSKKLLAIRFSTDRGSQDVELTNENSTEILRQTDCLIKYGAGNK